MKNFSTIFILFLALTVSGCGFEFIAAPIISGVIMWYEGEANKYYNYESEVMYRAVKRTAEELNFEIHENRSPDSDGDSYVAVGENDRFKITISKIESNITLVAIRINFMGDKPYAELFYERLDNQVNTIAFENGVPVANKH